MLFRRHSNHCYFSHLCTYVSVCMYACMYKKNSSNMKAQETQRAIFGAMNFCNIKKSNSKKTAKKNWIEFYFLFWRHNFLIKHKRLYLNVVVLMLSKYLAKITISLKLNNERNYVGIENSRIPCWDGVSIYLGYSGCERNDAAIYLNFLSES